jgi:hypothetical protein
MEFPSWVGGGVYLLQDIAGRPIEFLFVHICIMTTVFSPLSFVSRACFVCLEHFSMFIPCSRSVISNVQTPNLRNLNNNILSKSLWHTHTNIPFCAKFIRQRALSPMRYISFKKKIDLWSPAIEPWYPGVVLKYQIQHMWYTDFLCCISVIAESQ